MRQARVGEVVCRCTSYGFPHRWSGGKCNCRRWVADFFAFDRADCRHCVSRDGISCQVVEQIEAVFHCPALREHVQYEGIKLYGKARRELDRVQRRKAA